MDFYRKAACQLQASVSSSRSTFISTIKTSTTTTRRSVQHADGVVEIVETTTVDEERKEIPVSVTAEMEAAASRSKPAPAHRIKYSTGQAADTMREALEVVRKQANPDIKAVATLFGVGYDALYRRFHGTVSDEPATRTSLTYEQEKELASKVLQMGDHGFGFNTSELCAMAREISDDPNFKASPGWLQRFSSRWPQISRRRAQLFCTARANLSHEVAVEYFATLGDAIAEVEKLSGGVPLTPDRIWNEDE